jgi:uncharacterized protein
MDYDKKLCEVLSGFESLAIAFSGGIDSTLLLEAAIRAIGADRVLPVHIITPLSIKHETNFAIEWAREKNLKLEIIELDPLTVPEVVSNDPQRCYHCKKLLMQAVVDCALEHNFEKVADGTNTDDFNDYRPGMQACDELGVLHPLALAGMDKVAVVGLAKAYGLKNYNVPGSACLASRIPYGTELTLEGLRKVELAETYLHSLGFIGCRVRLLAETAKIELRNDLDFEKIIPLKDQIADCMESFGFKEILLDLKNYRQGSLNP